MKKIIFGLGLALALLTMGCAKDAAVATKATKKVKVAVSLDATRTEIGDNLSVVWSENDEVAAFAEESTEIYTAKIPAEAVGTKYAEIEMELPEEAMIATVVYPDMAISDAFLGSKKLRLSYTPFQEYKEGSFANNTSLLMGEAEIGEPIALKHLCAYIKVSVDADIKEVVFEAADGSAVAGDLEVTEEGLKPVAGVPALHITGIPAGKREFIFAVPSREYTAGFKVKFLESATNKYRVATAYSAGKTLVAGNLVSMPQVTLASLPALSERVIVDGADLATWLADEATACEATDVVLLGADVDMSGITVTPAESFNGVFDGQGFALKNYAATQPLFSANNGTIKNVVIDQSATLNIPAGQDLGAFLVGNNNGVVEGCINYGDVNFKGAFSSAVSYASLVAQTNAGADRFIRSCVNYGDITIECAEHRGGTAYVGTVGGKFSSTAGLNSGLFACVNHGNLTIKFLGDPVTETTKNTYIGGVTASSNSGTITTGCENYGDIEILTKGQAAAIILGGITSYAAGPIDKCVNKGNISIISESAEGLKDGQIKATLLGGIAGYINGSLSDSENNGDLTIKCSIFAGRNSIGGLDGTKSYSTATPAIGGLVAYGYDSSASPFSVKNCKNTGNIWYEQIACDITGNTYSGRHAFGGICAAPWGDIEDCENIGNLTVIMTTKDRIADSTNNVMPIVGGISGGDYYPKSQNNTNIRRCVNRGNIELVCDFSKSNCALGGIVGWPGVESSAQTTTREDCTNYGNIVVRGYGKVRIGGILGGSGHAKGCTNYGNLDVYDTAMASPVGAIAGFSTQAHKVEDCAAINCTVTAHIPMVQGVSGLVGNIGNVAGTYMKNCKAQNVTVVAPEGSNYGLVLGQFNGAGKAITVGPCQISGTVNKTKVTASNYEDYITTSSNYSPADHTFDVSFLSL